MQNLEVSNICYYPLANEVAKGYSIATVRPSIRPYPMQHGFRRKRSCETQLLEFVDDVSSNMSSGKQTDVLVMDFSKAFDKVSHSLLIHKLNHYGIRGKTNTWIQNFLSDRTQAVVVDGETSNFISVESGVPQGSVLGPASSYFTLMICHKGYHQPLGSSLMIPLST